MLFSAVLVAFTGCQGSELTPGPGLRQLGLPGTALPVWPAADKLAQLRREIVSDAPSRPSVPDSRLHASAAAAGVQHWPAATIARQPGLQIKDPALCHVRRPNVAAPVKVVAGPTEAAAAHALLDRLQQLCHPLDTWEAVKQHGSCSFQGPSRRGSEAATVAAGA